MMLTAKDKKQDLLTAMAAGADDYLAKPVDPSELKARISVAKRILDLISRCDSPGYPRFSDQALEPSEILASLRWGSFPEVNARISQWPLSWPTWITSRRSMIR